MNAQHYHLLTNDELERVARERNDALVQELLRRLVDATPATVECPECGHEFDSPTD